jgi:acetyltransferase
VNSLPPSWLQWMVHPDPLRDVALLAIAVDGRHPVCVGEARYALGDGPAGEREFALVVADEWQGVGLGSELLRQLGHRAALQGVERLVGDVMRDNLPMIELARRHGYAVRTHRADPRLLQVARSMGDAPRPGAARAAAQRPGAATALPAH